MPLKWGFHARPVAWGQATRLGVEKSMYVALSQLLQFWNLDEQRDKGFKVIIRREGEKLQGKEFS